GIRDFHVTGIQTCALPISAIDVHADFLDDPMAFVPPPEIFGELTARIDAADPAVRLIAAALSDPHAGEPALVGALRDAFAEHPEIGRASWRGRGEISELCG